MRRFLNLSLLIMLASCGPKPELKADHAWVRLAAVKGNPSAAYVTLHGGAVEERLMGVSSPRVVRTEMHDMSMMSGMAHMGAVDAGIAVPKGGTVTLAPGGKHIMLFDVAPDVVAGSKLPLSLSFASGAKLDVLADVKGAGDSPPK